MADEILRDEADITERGVDRVTEDPSAPLVDLTAEIAEGELEGPGLEPEQEVLTINVGPHHPATHGVLRLIVTLGRAGDRAEAGDGLPAYRDREVLRGQELLEGDPVRR